MEEKKIETPTLETPITVPETQPKKKKKGLLVLVIVLLVLFLLLGGYIVYTEFLQNKDEGKVEEIIEENEEEEEIEDLDSGVCEIGDENCLDEEEIVVSTEDEYTTFDGEIITTQLPEGWSIVEYFDGDGTESLPDMGLTYSGLTALDIINPENLQVFTLQAVSGIGFVGCPNYALFTDDGPSYHAQQQSAANEMEDILNVTDYTDSDYIEFEWLGITFRRIEDKYFYDMEEGNNYFEPPCVEGLLTLEGLYFTDEDGTIYEAYFYGPTEDATKDDLIVVDEILESMVLI